MPPLRRTVPAACLTLAGFVLVACSSDDPETADGAEEAVRDVLEAIDDGDYDDACDRWTEDYQKQSIDDWNKDFDDDSKVDSCEDMLRQAMALAEAFDDEFDLSIDKTTSEETDEGYDVTVVFKDGDEAVYQMVYDDGEWFVANEIDDTGEDEDAYDGSDETDGDDSSAAPAAPVPTGTAATVGDWTVTVTDVEEDATTSIKKASEFNDPAQEQYVLVSFTASYNGTERTADTGALSWSLTGADAVVRDPASQVTPNESKNSATQVRTGGTVEGQVLFDVDPAQLSDALLSVETWNDDGDQAYVDFELGAPAN